MEKVNYRITLDVHKGGIQKKISGFFTGDVMSRKIAIGLAAGGVSCKLEGDNIAALMYVTKPSGVTNYGACEIIDNTVYYDVIQADTDMDGIVEMQLKVMSSDIVLYAPRFSLEVQAGNSDDVAEASPQFTALEAAILKANEGKITPKGEWSPDVTYKYLDHVTHNGSSFIALKPSVGREPVEGEYWTVSLQGAIDFKLIADGSVPAGDAKQLGGKNAALYASKDDLTKSNKELRDALKVESDKIAEIANNQIPEEYLEAAVDKYVEDNSAGFATRASLEAVETDLKSDLSEIDSEMKNYYGYFTCNIIGGEDFNDGGIINKANGSIVANENFCFSNKISVHTDVLYVTRLAADLHGKVVCWKDDTCLGEATYEDLTNAWRATLIPGTNFVTFNCGLDDKETMFAYPLFNVGKYNEKGVIISKNQIALNTPDVYPAESAQQNTANILNALNTFGICNLQKGIYPIETFTMPQHTTIRGCGFDTVLRYAVGGSAIIVNEECCFENIRFQGSGTAKPTERVTGNNGLYIADNKQTVKITNCTFELFKGFAIYVKNVGYGELRSVDIVNTDFFKNAAGIMFEDHGEYGLISNCNFIDNYIGVDASGGNNQFSNCGFNRNYIGFYINGDSIDNEGHGSAVGCSFNHNERGIDVYANDCGYVFNGCSIFRNEEVDVKLFNCRGNNFTGCNFGIGSKFAFNTAFALFSSCVFGNTPTSEKDGGKIISNQLHDFLGNDITL